MTFSAKGWIRAGTALTCLGLATYAAGDEKLTTYDGVCDASAGIALDAHHFVIADNNTDALRVYSYSGGKAVQKPRDLSDFLGAGDGKEADLEAGARIGNRLWWITSHGLNKDAERKEIRYRLFATKVSIARGAYRFKPIGEPYKQLMDMALADPAYATSGLREAATKSPEKGGINIEGLAEGPDGGLYVGLRSPVGDRGAMIIPLLNPDKVIAGKPAELGAPVFLDMQGSGIRSLEKIGKFYFVIAGPAAGKSDFSLYRWDGKAGGKLERIMVFSSDDDLKPEAIFAMIGSDDLYVLSDDGDHIAAMNGDKKCEKLDPSVKHFRGFKIKTPQ
ncbi:DUF3616 domain-containing protein [Rhizobium sp. KVB221]|uniref:DUF3616 domain-containing protein n=1 Tax=Rhizobium setariae TaxID=2801340 RepID=A0A936YIV3_9HYPH|nr:DUF3616 domain-containing protein [Rhizobium setariae]MBL0371035.1 DUF3616 domain-containing protein [Rhizobium setariae]